MQVSRAIKRAFLQAVPSSIAARLLRKYPNLRKSAPPGRSFIFGEYCSDIRVNVDTLYKVERIMWSGSYEPKLVEFLDTRNASGWTCLDIGANVGAVTLLLAKLVGAEGKVFAIEPGPPNLRRLQKNLDLNPELARRVQVVPAGMGRSRSELWWAEEKGNPGNALLSQEGTHRIPVDTVDNFVREHDLDRLDFVKIDVEGMELDVMHGAAETLRRFCPILYFETLARYSEVHHGGNFQLIESFLTGACGYELFRIGTGGELEPVTQRNLDDYTVAIHPTNVITE